jgi:hypothetical protein
MIISLAITGAALVLLLRGQLRAEPVRAEFVLPALLALIGALEVAAFLIGKQHLVSLLKGHPQHVTIHHGPAIIVQLAGSLVLAALTAALRIPSIRLWWRDDQVWRRGSWLTILLWLVSLALHLAYDAIIAANHGTQNFGAATLLLYFAASLFVQRLLLMVRRVRMIKASSTTR